MKQLFFTGLLALGAAMPAYAQSGGYEDDVYSNSTPSRKQEQDRYQQDDRYSSSGNQSSNDNGSYRNDGRSYAADDYDYIDYDDDYNYSTRFRRFNAPMYNVGYWSGFWNPWGYDPFWGPAGGFGYGWGAPYRPGFTISVGYGGPYWSSYYGMNNWYGYPSFASCWGGYPYYGAGYGGYGYGNGYQNGYWNGYYAGLYGAGYGAPYAMRRVTYGPRYSATNGYNGYRAIPESGLRSAGGTSITPATNYGPRETYRRTDNQGRNLSVVNEAGQPIRNVDRGELTASPTDGGRGTRFFENSGRQPNVNESTAPVNQDRPRRSGWFSNSNDATTARPIDRAPMNNNEAAPTTDRPRRGGWFSNDNGQNAPVDRSSEMSRPNRGGWNDRSSQINQPQRQEGPRQWGGSREQVGGGFERPQRSFEQPRMEQPRMEQPRFEQPRISAPRMEAPRMSAPSAPSGGGNFGGGAIRRR
jgi:hypothetical protein